jgi:predicted RNA-binding Zn-ribbon protein involved in translation (DUF1610 family)
MKCPVCGFEDQMEDFIILDKLMVMQVVKSNENGGNYTEIFGSDERKYLYACPNCGILQIEPEE